MTSHQNAVTFVDWCTQALAPSDGDRFSSHAPFHFDLSILDLYLPLKHGATLFLVFLATLVFARRMVKPIRRLTDIAGDYSRGKLNAKIPGTMRGDEIGALARAVERMGVSIKMAFEELRNSARAA